MTILRQLSDLQQHSVLIMCICLHHSGPSLFLCKSAYKIPVCELWPPADSAEPAARLQPTTQLHAVSLSFI